METIGADDAGGVTDRRIVLPAPEARPPAARLPLLALLAPPAVALGLWAVTGQAFALVFAALGPIGALAAYADQRWTRRREARRARARWQARLDACRTRIDDELAQVATRLANQAPSGAAIIARGREPHIDHASAIVLGRAPIPSALEVTLPDVPVDEPDERLEALAAHARVVDGPLLSPPGARVGVVGEGVLARSCWRGLVVQLMARGDTRLLSRPADPPAFGELTVAQWTDAAESQARDGGGPGAPPRPPMSWVVVGGTDSSGDPTHTVEGNSRSALVALAPRLSALPRACDVVLRIAAGRAHVERHPDPDRRGPVALDPVADAELRWWAQSRAAEAGCAPGRLEPIALRELLPADADSARDARTAQTRQGAARSLACVPAVTTSGPMTIDLVQDGPHALVAGTTGSGKSELLVSWMLAIAAAHPPERVGILLVDFKGGAAFEPLRELPHVVGTVTDLDGDRTERALVSLRAELRRRERLLAAAGARAIEETELERLVVVVDEFAALLDAHPELQPLLSDLAARGRSLGIHLVLCTQRPVGVVRDAVLANIDLRICLRVNNESDSRAVVDSVGAALIPASAPGRALVRRAGTQPTLVQFAEARPADIVSVASRWIGGHRPFRPWVEPLPDRVEATELSDGGGAGRAFGLLDLPQEQRRAVARWLPERDGSVLVLGARGSGRTTALAALGAHAIPSRPDLAWDALTSLADTLDRDRGPRVVGIDDLDALIPRFGPEHRPIVLECLARLLREGPAAGLHLVVTAQRLVGEAHPIAGLVPSTLFLRHGSRHDWALSGGEMGEAHTSGPAGSGRWEGHRIQVAAASVAPPATTGPIAVALNPARPWALVVGAPSDARYAAGRTLHTLEQFTAGVSSGPATAIVGSVDEWSARWGLLSTARESAEVVLVGCTAADIRGLTRSRLPAPPLPPGGGWAWVWSGDGVLRRTRLSGPAEEISIVTPTMDSASLQALAALKR